MSWAGLAGLAPESARIVPGNKISRAGPANSTRNESAGGNASSPNGLIQPKPAGRGKSASWYSIRVRRSGLHPGMVRSLSGCGDYRALDAPAGGLEADAEVRTL
jgi:hypothetical protein